MSDWQGVFMKVPSIYQYWAVIQKRTTSIDTREGRIRVMAVNPTEEQILFARSIHLLRILAVDAHSWENCRLCNGPTRGTVTDRLIHSSPDCLYLLISDFIADVNRYEAPMIEKIREEANG